MRRSVDQILRELLAVCPSGEIAEDNNGDLVFYTGISAVGLSEEKDPNLSRQAAEQLREDMGEVAT